MRGERGQQQPCSPLPILNLTCSYPQRASGWRLGWNRDYPIPTRAKIAVVCFQSK